MKEIKNIKPGFKYLAFIGYKWIEVEYPKSGFSKDQLKEAFAKGIAKPL